MKKKKKKKNNNNNKKEEIKTSEHASRWEFLIFWLK